MTIFAWLAASRIGRWIASVLAALAVIGGLIFRAKRQGRADAIKDIEDADQAEADALRRRVDLARRHRLPDPQDDRGFRDR